ncbi:MAG: ATP-dependent endonuclease [Arcobacter sp.]|uniref:ATP-dependent nuclease n=1 Tax=Arcobacter sp. TaxID=1872629 RepID=UPI003D0210B9
MYIISKIIIKRFRSNFDLKLDIENNSIVTICGANNSGKTNTLRAINVFFNPHLYERNKDVPFHKLEGSRGASQYPEITLVFKDNNNEYEIIRTFGMEDSQFISLVGKKYNLESPRNKEVMTIESIENILNHFDIYSIETINVNFPELISKIINDVYEIEFSKSRISKELRTAFSKYVDGVLQKLNTLAKDISSDFKLFNMNWGVEFASKTDIKKFTDLINDDIEFLIKDNSNKYVDSKGSGLQKLAYFLLITRIIETRKDKNIILLIDEPDTFLHNRLQILLKDKLNNLLDKSQIFITTHSKTLIDTYTLKNVFLYDVDYSSKSYVRIQGKEIIQTTTKIVDLNKEEGSKKIKEYLGIEEDNYDLLSSYTILVEGESDKKYLAEIAKYLNIKLPKIESVDGADNVEKYLNFYNSIYKIIPDKKPKILVLLDNDPKGKEVFSKINKKIISYQNLSIKVFFITGKNEYIEYENYEIEDFVEHKTLLYLTNEILFKAGYKKISEKDLTKKLKNKELKKRGILSLLEIAKSEANSDGTNISIETEKFKKNLAEHFTIEGNKKLIDMMNISEQIKEMKEFIIKISEYNNL